MTDLSVKVASFVQSGSDGGETITADEFKQLVETARQRTSADGERISYGELKALFTASKAAPDIRYAMGQLGLTVTDLQNVLRGMLADGSISETELLEMYEAAIAPKDHAEAGASVTAEEADFFNNLDRSKMSSRAQRTFNDRVAPRLTAMLDVPARQAGVSVRSPATEALMPIMPRGPRDSNVAARIDGKWPGQPIGWSGYGSCTVRINAASFQIGSVATPPTGWYSGDGVQRYGSWRNNDTGVAQITQMPADGQLHFTLMTHPSGHNDSNGGSDTQDFSRTNRYFVNITMNYGERDARTYRMRDIRNSPHGVSQYRTLKAIGNEEYVTAQDISIDASEMAPGTKIRVEMWPTGTSQWGYSTQRVFDLVIPNDWVPVSQRQNPRQQQEIRR